MYDSHAPPMFHPKPVPFARPPFTSSYSSPASSLPRSSLASPPASPPSASSFSCSPSPPPSHMKLQTSSSSSASSSSSSKHTSSRPKMTKKVSSTTTGKHKNVQVSLEVKVERSRGFHAFFVPLARPMPSAPPSSPVFGQSTNHHHQRSDHASKSCEESWVEDVGQSMDIDT